VATSVSIGIYKWRHLKYYKNEIGNSVEQELRHSPNTFIACHPDVVCPRKLPALPVWQFFNPATNAWGSYVIWNQKTCAEMLNVMMARTIADIPKTHKGYNNYLYLTLNKIQEDSARHYSITLLKEAPNDLNFRTEKTGPVFYLYKLPDK
jgi:hypothetical protein